MAIYDASACVCGVRVCAVAAAESVEETRKKTKKLACCFGRWNVTEPCGKEENGRRNEKETTTKGTMRGRVNEIHTRAQQASVCEIC